MTQTANSTSAVTATPAADPADAARHFAGRLAHETDPADVWAAIRAGRVDFTLVDARATAAYRKTHLPGAVSLPHGDITAATAAALPAGLLVTYCWGPACNGSTRAAAKLAAHGRQVKEMIGGLEYWIRAGHPTEDARPRNTA